MSIIEATFFTGPKSRPVHHDLDGVLDAIKHGVQAASTPQAAVASRQNKAADTLNFIANSSSRYCRNRGFG